MTTETEAQANEDGEVAGPAMKLLRTQLEEALETNRTLEARLQSVEKSSIFGRLGIDTSSGMGQFVFEKYDGEVTEEAVKAFAENMGLLADQTQTETTPPGEAEVLQDMGNTQSATPPQPPASLEQQLANANSPEELEALMRSADLVS